MEKFGEIEFISLREECPVGLVLRQGKNGVVLEMYLDTEAVDVVHVFDENIDLDKQEDIYHCLTVARIYEPDVNTVIYIDKGNYPDHEGEERAARAAYIRAVVECSRRRSYEMGIRRN